MATIINEPQNSQIPTRINRLAMIRGKARNAHILRGTHRIVPSQIHSHSPHSPALVLGGTR